MSILNFLFMIVGIGLNLTAGNAKLTAVNLSKHVIQLYEELGTENVPPETDPAFLDQRVTERICKEISHSGFFNPLGLVPLETRKMYRLRHIRNYSRRTLQNSQERGIQLNLYQERKFRVPGFRNITEHVFACLFKKMAHNYILPAYISKEYNLGSLGQPFMPGRFVFVNLTPGDSDLRDHNVLVTEGPHNLLLAEEPANVTTTENNFNLELYYLQLRSNAQLAENNESDPLCQLISDSISDPVNQHYRLCVAILRSSCFENLIAYPQQCPHACVLREVSFKTIEAKDQAAEKLYQERMTLCPSQCIDYSQEAGSLYYISKAYKSNNVFVYRRDSSDGLIYLENLFNNVNIIDVSSLINFIRD